MHFPLLILVLVLAQATPQAQPLVDIIQLRYTHGFPNTNAEATSHRHLWIGCDILPGLRKNANNFLILSPTYEQWHIYSLESSLFPAISSFSFPAGIALQTKDSIWGLNMLAVPRWNGEKLFADNTFQFGGVLLLVFAPKPGLKFKTGIYANKEFFGTYIVPLFGIDWRIGKNNILFGNLPGRLTFEHRWNDHFYAGATFRAITNSYRLSDGQYVRLDDNQVSLFLDFYAGNNICFTLEPGYGLCRNLRTGVNDKNYIREVDWGDGAFVKLSASYRLRLD